MGIFNASENINTKKLAPNKADFISHNVLPPQLSSIVMAIPISEQNSTA